MSEICLQPTFDFGIDLFDDLTFRVEQAEGDLQEAIRTCQKADYVEWLRWKVNQRREALRRAERPVDRFPTMDAINLPWGY